MSVWIAFRKKAHSMNVRLPVDAAVKCASEKRWNMVIIILFDIFYFISKKISQRFSLFANNTDRQKELIRIEKISGKRTIISSFREMTKHESRDTYNEWMNMLVANAWASPNFVTEGEGVVNKCNSKKANEPINWMLFWVDSHFMQKPKSEEKRFARLYWHIESIQHCTTN